MKILITGATGFLGTSLVKKLTEQKHDLVCLNSKNCDLTQPESLYHFNDQKYDQIFHLAAWTQAGDFCLHHPGEQWLINQKINTNVLSWWQACQPQAKLIAMGTSCAYAPNAILTEENYLEGQPIESLYTYAMTKRMMYVGLQALHKQYDLQYLYAVPSTLYGADYHTDGRQMHFIFDLIRKIRLGKTKQVPVQLWGDGYQSRELVYVDDFVDILLKLNTSVTNEIVNIGAGTEYTIREFCRILCDIIGYDANLVEYDTTKYVGAKSKCLNIDKLKSLIPDLEFTSLEQGLETTINWFDKHIPIV